MSTAISQLLGRVRKRGLHATLGAGDLPVWRRAMPRRVTVGDEVLGILAQALHIEPATLTFPEEREDGAAAPVEGVDLTKQRCCDACARTFR